MNRSLFSLSTLAAAVLLVGCASEPKAPPAPATPQAAAAAAQAAAAAAANDATIAQKLKGQWVGEWVFPGYASGKFVLIGTGAEGSNLKGELQVYGTSNGDIKMPIKSAVVQNGELKIVQDGNMKFNLKHKTDTVLVGGWEINGFSGDLKVTRQ
jgi:hypothetical protein